MKTKNVEDDAIENKCLEMALKCDKKVKEERIRCVRYNRIESMSVSGNEALQCRKEILEKSASEVIKIKDSDDHCKDYMQHKYGENGN